MSSRPKRKSRFENKRTRSSARLEKDESSKEPMAGGSKGEKSQASSSKDSTDPLQCKTPDKSGGESPNTGGSSPDPNCPICLGKLENKSFTDSCFHTFCFVCLLEWAKVKAVCPLCKQPFKSIVHNVRSMDDYDQYHLRADENGSLESPDGNRFRYRTTLTTDRWMSRQQRDQRRQLELLQRPTRFFARENWRRMRQAATSAFRRRIYTRNEWVRETPQRQGRVLRVRDVSAEFFSRNPACSHRLVPWLNRELNVLLYNHEDQVQFVLELILDLIKRFEIMSEEFGEHIRPFFDRNTDHFIHEFYHFARSPCDMITYDQNAMYREPDNTVYNIESSSPSSGGNDSDVILLSPDANTQAPSMINNRDHSYFSVDSGATHNPEPPAERRDPTANLSTLTPILDRVRDFLFAFNATDTAHTGWDSPLPGPSSFWSPGPSSFSSPPRPHTPVQEEVVVTASETVKTESNSSSDSDSDSNTSHSSDASDVIVVAYEKPWESRTPIELSSADEEDNRAWKEAKRKSKLISKKRKERKTPERYRRNRYSSRSRSRSRHRDDRRTRCRSYSYSRSRSSSPYSSRRNNERRKSRSRRSVSRTRSRSPRFSRRSKSRTKSRSRSPGRDRRYRSSYYEHTISYHRRTRSRSPGRTRSRSHERQSRRQLMSHSHPESRYRRETSRSGTVMSSSARNTKSRSKDRSLSKSKSGRSREGSMSRSGKSKSHSPSKSRKEKRKLHHRSSSIEIIGEKYGNLTKHKHKKSKKSKKKSKKSHKHKQVHILSDNDTSDIEIIDVVPPHQSDNNETEDRPRWKKHPTGHKKSTKGNQDISKSCKDDKDKSGSKESEAGCSKWKPVPESESPEAGPSTEGQAEQSRVRIELQSRPRCDSLGDVKVLDETGSSTDPEMNAPNGESSQNQSSPETDVSVSTMKTIEKAICKDRLDSSGDIICCGDNMKNQTPINTSLTSSARNIERESNTCDNIEFEKADHDIEMNTAESDSDTEAYSHSLKSCTDKELSDSDGDSTNCEDKIGMENVHNDEGRAGVCKEGDVKTDSHVSENISEAPAVHGNGSEKVQKLFTCEINSGHRSNVSDKIESSINISEKENIAAETSQGSDSTVRDIASCEEDNKSQRENLYEGEVDNKSQSENEAEVEDDSKSHCENEARVEVDNKSHCENEAGVQDDDKSHCENVSEKEHISSTPSTSQESNFTDILQAVFGPDGLVNRTKKQTPATEHKKSSVMKNDVFLPIPSDADTDQQDIFVAENLNSEPTSSLISHSEDLLHETGQPAEHTIPALDIIQPGLEELEAVMRSNIMARMSRNSQENSTDEQMKMNCSR